MKNDHGKIVKKSLMNRQIGMRLLFECKELL
jgi:hypothetical protein